MVALNEIILATRTDSKRRHRGSSVSSVFQKSAQSAQSVDRFLFAPPKNPPRYSVASVVKESVNTVVSLCRGGKNRLFIFHRAPHRAVSVCSENSVAISVNRIYFLQDANWNPTSIMEFNSSTSTWDVVQRYVYSPYGNITILNADWSATPTGTIPDVLNLYQGMQYDRVTGLYYDHARNYSTTLGTWTSQDPAGYINGANTYQFVMSNPVGNVDATGLCDCNNKINAWWSGMGNAIGNAVDKVDRELVPENMMRPPEGERAIWERTAKEAAAVGAAIWNYAANHPYPLCAVAPPPPPTWSWWLAHYIP